ncbi:hypothetical protein F5Y13DRAFT_167152 [Hypoxylon sp. FL1857]|nr:hypothetical protein F5Y13DRAFT_167152 [Hypoxylon sp. FL1857]
MSFGFGVGDFIAGANLAHKLIRVMTETRGATAEYQEALAEVCGIQQIFIQLTQLCRSEVLPRATLNSIAQIVMPSMKIIADFLDKIKNYQAKLSSNGGLSSSWCKMGWALFRKDELKALRDTLHSRLSAISTLLTAANHLPSLPDSIAQYQVRDDEDQEATNHPPFLSASFVGNSEFQQRVSGHHGTRDVSVDFKTCSIDGAGNKIETEAPDAALRSDSNMPLPLTAIEWKKPIEEEGTPNAQNINEKIEHTSSKREESPQTLGSAHQQQKCRQTHPPLQASCTGANQFMTRSEMAKGIPKQQNTNRDLDTYLQTLFESALSIQAEAEAKAAAERKAAEEAEWRQRMQEVIRIETEIEVRKKIDNEQKEAEQNVKAPIRLKDAVGRKFSFPFKSCNTWQGMEDLIKQAFIHVDVIGPHVQAGHYDLVDSSGEIILPQTWEKVIQPDWALTMHMWPMARPRPVPLFPGPGGVGKGGIARPVAGPLPLPRIVGGGPSPRVHSIDSSDDSASGTETETETDRKFSLRAYVSKKAKRLRARISSRKSDDEDDRSSESDCSSLKGVPVRTRGRR